MHDVVDVSGWDEGSPEPMGRSGKVWLIADDNEVWLFKPIDIQTHRHDGTQFAKGNRLGRADRLGCRNAARCPAARVELAQARR